MTSLSINNLISCCLLLISVFDKTLTTTIFSPFSTEYYYHDVVQLGADKIRTNGGRLTVDDCYVSDTLIYDTKTCQLVRDDPGRLDDLSYEFFNPKYNQWQEKIETYFTPKGEEKRSRKKRFAEEKELSRSKRGAYGNPCIDHSSMQTVVIYAIDSETEEVVELLQDPNTEMYQTFFTYDCRTSIIGFLCKEQYLEFYAAVFTGYYYDVEVRQVKVPVTCAISIGY